MTAAQIAREFTRLQRMQRDLRLYEVLHGDVCAVVFLRRHVVEQMRRLAKLMRYGATAAMLVMLCMPALAQHHHPVADIPIHEKFYQGWYMPDKPTQSCCSGRDCYPVEITYRDGRVYAKRREDGKWLHIPQAKIETKRDSPDGRNHLCAPPPNPMHSDAVYCFAFGAGI